MTDLLCVLPHFPIGQYASLVPALERHQLTTSDLLTLDVTDIGKRTQLPLLDVKRLCNAVLDALHRDLGVAPNDAQDPTPRQNKHVRDDPRPAAGPAYQLRHTHASLAAQWQTISTLDPALDRALGGGVPAGYVTEVTGESGAGKTQLLLSLLLAVQLPPPRGLGRQALYISTEAPLSTRRLAQILANNPALQAASSAASSSGQTGPPPSLDNIISASTPDLESQDHILSFQVPVEVERRNVGLVVLDSVAANYRAEFERGGGRGGGSNMAARSADLVRLGSLLRDLARRHNLAVVVSNQVADRFGAVRSPAPPAPWTTAMAAATQDSNSNSSPLASRSRAAAEPLQIPSSSSLAEPGFPRSSMPDHHHNHHNQQPPAAPPVLLLDHQQRWFSGWGDDPPGVVDDDDDGAQQQLKTPSLGLVWSTQVAARVALVKRPAYGGGRRARYRVGEEGEGEGGLRGKIKLVLCLPPSRCGLFVRFVETRFENASR
ncbi:P-loop containing nucleoside triphosphate hydrolase protein [Phialemonium atrogriseum]|uniref:P-loop containing nucleoside triphosphate hydrolase protein n=1 Tax=Phialemonium atrogriseum TaxID=1093897 RepID=A0AAJ0CBY3_9PEZI|nr:P-loop containing nucleoside triphosphate hydrolase protein [Phialemonium atrogriseum]KAK1772414.1 P-loop containing nucleoside triphosphate hydrolase protein [Phialemonium atrogriseum]